jgi:hypothetical protein
MRKLAVNFLICLPRTSAGRQYARAVSILLIVPRTAAPGHIARAMLQSKGHGDWEMIVEIIP